MGQWHNWRIMGFGFGFRVCCHQSRVSGQGGQSQGGQSQARPPRMELPLPKFTHYSTAAAAPAIFIALPTDLR